MSVDVYHGDCKDVLQSFPSGSFDLIFTSPPYGLARVRTYGGIPTSEYVAWFLPRSKEFFRTLKNSGSFLLNIKEGCENGERSTYVMELIIALRKQGWRWIETYCWHKSTSMPGYWPARLRDAWEPVYHFARTTRPVMYQDAVRVPVAASTVERMRHLSAEDRTRHQSATGSGMGRRHDVWLGKRKVLPSNVVTLCPTNRNTGHPASFPPSLPEFFIRLFTKGGDRVLDPYAGSGTTLTVADRLGRDAVGIEINRQYYDRLAKELGK